MPVVHYEGMEQKILELVVEYGLESYTADR